MKVRPLGDRVLVRPEDVSEVSAGGVVLPAQAQEKPRMGTVISVGGGLLDAEGKRVAPQVEPGEMVLYSQYGGVDVEVGEEKLLILREGDLLGVIENDNNSITGSHSHSGSVARPVAA